MIAGKSERCADYWVSVRLPFILLLLLLLLKLLISMVLLELLLLNHLLLLPQVGSELPHTRGCGGLSGGFRAE